MASKMSIGAMFLFSLLCIVVKGGMYFEDEIGDCNDQGRTVELGAMYHPNVCTTCQCVQEKVAKCLRMVCGPCEAGQVAEAAEGQCCPQCVPRQ